MTSREVQDAVGAGHTLEQRRQELARIIATPTEKEQAAQQLAEIDARIAAEREASAIKNAKERQVGIRRAHGSRRAERERLLTRFLELAGGLEDTARALVAVDADMRHYQSEDAALADRFGTSPSALPNVQALGVAPEAIEAGRRIRSALDAVPEHRSPELPAKELCEHKLRERRSYREIEGTDAYKIIEAAGLKPFPELTENQRRILAARAREREQEQRAAASLPQPLPEPPAGVSIRGVI